MIELLLRSDLAVEFTEFKIVLPRAAMFLAGSHPVGLSPRWPECPLLAQSGQFDRAGVCPLLDNSGQSRILAGGGLSVNDPKRTLTRQWETEGCFCCG
jgi:hypothetical protein